MTRFPRAQSEQFCPLDGAPEQYGPKRIVGTLERLAADSPIPRPDLHASSLSALTNRLGVAAHLLAYLRQREPGSVKRTGGSDLDDGGQLESESRLAPFQDLRRASIPATGLNTTCSLYLLET